VANEDEAFPDDPPIARIVRKVDSAVGLAEQVLLFVLLAFLVFVTLIWFVTEHFSNTPLENASYDVRYTVFLMAMVGGAFAAHHRRLLSMDVVSRMVSAKTRGWIRVATTTFGAFMSAVFLKYGLWILDQPPKLLAETEHWMPAFAGNAAMAIGAGLLLFHLTIQVVIDLDYLVRGKAPPDPEMGAA
jgi:TRAP-type C4-dicarboxylate transport system permease small subunit